MGRTELLAGKCYMHRNDAVIPEHITRFPRPLHDVWHGRDLSDFTICFPFTSEIEASTPLALCEEQKFNVLIL